MRSFLGCFTCGGPNPLQFCAKIVSRRLFLAVFTFNSLQRGKGTFQSMTVLHPKPPRARTCRLQIILRGLQMLLIWPGLRTPRRDRYPRSDVVPSAVQCERHAPPNPPIPKPIPAYGLASEPQCLGGGARTASNTGELAPRRAVSIGVPTCCLFGTPAVAPY